MEIALGCGPLGGPIKRVQQEVWRNYVQKGTLIILTQQYLLVYVILQKGHTGLRIKGFFCAI